MLQGREIACLISSRINRSLVISVPSVPRILQMRASVYTEVREQTSVLLLMNADKHPDFSEV